MHVSCKTDVAQKASMDLSLTTSRFWLLVFPAYPPGNLWAWGGELRAANPPFRRSEGRCAGRFPHRLSGLFRGRPRFAALCPHCLPTRCENDDDDGDSDGEGGSEFASPSVLTALWHSSAFPIWQRLLAFPPALSSTLPNACQCKSWPLTSCVSVSTRQCFYGLHFNNSFTHNYVQNKLLHKLWWKHNHWKSIHFRARFFSM